MLILRENNLPFNMDQVPEKVDNIMFCVLDYNNTESPDYYFIPLIFLESFSSPAVDLKVGNSRIQIPLDWSIVIGDKHSGHLEIISIKQCMDRDFQAFTFNPIRGFRHEYQTIEVENVFPDVKWYFPKLKYGYFLASPIDNKENSQCIFILKDANKVNEVLDSSKLV